MTSPLLDALGRFFYPGSCPACGAPGRDDDLCAACARVVPGAAGFRTPEPLSGRDVLVAARYDGVVRDLVLKLKFGRDAHPAAALGALLAAAVSPSFARDADCVVPMPLSRRRLRERGYNQAALIARVVAGAVGVPVLRLLRRPVHTAAQADLGPRERARNVRGAFLAGDRCFGRAILLVDDVITTGHTMAQAAAALDRGDARRVLCAAVAESGWDPA